MPLISIWQTNPSAISEFTIEQIVSVAGNGDLRDSGQCSRELRDYLAEVSTDQLANYLDYCLANSFQKNGLVLQDIVNELGRRPDYFVEFGRYQGTVNSIGYDGIWKAPERNTLILEVKTTDAYRISLDRLAGYRKNLIESSLVSSDSSILIVTGRQDTGELEAQIRGSRLAWDIRLISADALIKLVRIKESTENQETAEKIRRILAPLEFTRLDGFIDVIFTTAKDVESVVQSEPIDGKANEDNHDDSVLVSSADTSDPAALDRKRQQLIDLLNQHLNSKMVKSSRALYRSADNEVHIAPAISKRYLEKGKSPYWYAFHPQWNQFLDNAPKSLFVLGCMDRDEAYAIPLKELRRILPSLNTITRPDGKTYRDYPLDAGRGISSPAAGMKVLTSGFGVIQPSASDV
jgi:hypothetical protein